MRQIVLESSLELQGQRLPGEPQRQARPPGESFALLDLPTCSLPCLLANNFFCRESLLFSFVRFVPFVV